MVLNPTCKWDLRKEVWRRPSNHVVSIILLLSSWENKTASQGKVKQLGALFCVSGTSQIESIKHASSILNTDYFKWP